MGNTQLIFKGEKVVLSGTLKDGTTPVPGKVLMARFMRKGANMTIDLGEETFMDEGEGNYSMLIDTNKYCGALCIRVFLREPSGDIIVSNDTVTININRL